MSESLLNIQFDKLNLDQTSSQAIEQLLAYSLSLIDPAKEPEAIAYLSQLQKQIVQLRSQKGNFGSKKIHVGVSELRQAFHAHSQSAAAEQIKQISAYLLLFYAVECGLKSIWLKQNKLQTTEQIPDRTLLSKDGHNLDRWVKELKISASQVSATPDFHLEKGGFSLNIEKAHQAWRYNIRLKGEDEKVLVEWLNSICNWIKENINR
ncbi:MULTISPECIES: hypothetical protein [Planktothricoides]|uniref:Uncharacterized protein n=1 Tax=Planktothricoides raciborskii GIHE-MW2 TaxID=2792601 RepID=A0AAU8JK19_9CYAN|nr:MULTISPECIES: hypothetical protein [Planktothricoides]